MVAVKENGINDLIFKELIKRGYSIEDEKKVWNISDTKLWYLTDEQSKTYLEYLDSNEERKGIAEKEVSLIIEHICDIKDMIKDSKVNLVDLGCGDGRKSAELIKLLKEKGMDIRYCPIDISSYMVKKTHERFANLDLAEVVDFKYNISDFENLANITPLLRTAGYEKNIIIFLGNMLPHAEINDFLYKIRRNMKEGDIFITDILINDKRFEAYKGNPHFNKWAVSIPKNLGFEENEVNLNLRKKESHWEIYFEILKEKKLNLGGKEIEFRPGDEVITLIQFRHSKEDLRGYLNLYFERVEFFTTQEDGEMLAICKK